MESIFNSPESLVMLFNEVCKDISDNINYYPKSINIFTYDHAYSFEKTIQVIIDGKMKNIIITPDVVKFADYDIRFIRDDIKEFMLKCKEEYLIKKLAGLE